MVKDMVFQGEGISCSIFQDPVMAEYRGVG